MALLELDVGLLYFLDTASDLISFYVFYLQIDVFNIYASEVDLLSVIACLGAVVVTTVINSLVVTHIAPVHTCEVVRYFLVDEKNSGNI